MLRTASRAHCVSRAFRAERVSTICQHVGKPNRRQRNVLAVAEECAGLQGAAGSWSRHTRDEVQGRARGARGVGQAREIGHLVVRPKATRAVGFDRSGLSYALGHTCVSLLEVNQTGGPRPLFLLSFLNLRKERRREDSRGALRSRFFLGYTCVTITHNSNPIDQKSARSFGQTLRKTLRKNAECTRHGGCTRSSRRSIGSRRRSYDQAGI